MWSESGFIATRIEVDSEFFERKAEVVYDFFVYGMLPVKWYTRRPVADATNIISRMAASSDHEDYEDEGITKLWCYCQEPVSVTWCNVTMKNL